MAARKQLFHPDEVKDRIKITQLINRLTAHALSDDPTMNSSQVRAAQILLAKAVPDLKSVEYTGEGGGPLQVVITRFAED